MLLRKHETLNELGKVHIEITFELRFEGWEWRGENICFVLGGEWG